MTTNYNPNRERIGTLIAFIILCLIVMILASCSDKATRKLNRADKLIKQAEALGAKVKSDTVYKLDTIYVPVVGIETDTIFQSTPGDTVRVVKERLKITYVELRGDSVYIQGECEADTVIQVRNIPVTVTKEISSGYSLWDLIILAVFCFAVGYIFGMFRKRKSLG